VDINSISMGHITQPYIDDTHDATLSPCHVTTLRHTPQPIKGAHHTSFPSFAIQPFTRHHRHSPLPLSHSPPVEIHISRTYDVHTFIVPPWHVTSFPTSFTYRSEVPSLPTHLFHVIHYVTPTTMTCTLRHSRNNTLYVAWLRPHSSTPATPYPYTPHSITSILTGRT